MVQLSDWQGILNGRSDPPDGLFVRAPLKPSPQGGSGTFLALASDDRRWWVKPLNNLQGERVVVSEHVVGRLGTLIGAPTCEVSVVRIPTEIQGWEFRPGARLVAGFAALNHVHRDDNRRRHAGVVALYDWCWGNDDQWLYCESDDRKLYSHDHGHYLPGGPHWTPQALLPVVDEPHGIRHATDAVDVGELERLAGALESITRDNLRAILSGVPAAWPIATADLEALGFFLDRRRTAVADRLRTMVRARP